MVAASPRWLRPALVLLGVAVLFVLVGRSLGGLLVQATTGIRGLGAWGPAAFVGLYVVACVLAIPGSILTLAAGAIFGIGLGVALAFGGALLGSTAAFVVARYAARGLVERRLGTDPRVASLDQAIAGRGRLIVFLLRLSPVFPFSLLNYALGLTKVSLVDYVIGGVGMLPGTLLYVYYGKVAGDVAAVASGHGAPAGPATWGLLAVGLVATFAVTIVVTRLARKTLAAQTDVVS
jgi:uncharacterized membrane protein YdjX (TVP38/TMEM64 family)